jgi:hypothetical protein
MGQAVARISVVERKWVKDSQNFPAELRDLWVVAEANLHHLSGSGASSRFGALVSAEKWAQSAASFGRL